MGDLVLKITDYYKAERYEEALKALKKAEKLPADDEERVWILLMMGVVLAELDKSSEALNAFVVALDLKQEAKLPVASSLKVLTLFKRAPAELPAYREKRKKELTTLTLAAYEERRYPDVFDAVAKLKRLNGLSRQDLAWAELMEGVAQGELGKMKEAEEAFNRALPNAIEMGIPVPTSHELLQVFERARSEQRKKYWLREAEQLFASKKPSDVLTVLIKAEQSSTLVHAEKLLSLVLRGQALVELNRSAEAMSLFREALSMDPKATLVAPTSPEQRRLFDRAWYDLCHPFQPHAYVAGGVGTAVIGGGALLMVQAKGLEQKLRSADPSVASPEQRQETVRTGQVFQTAGWSLIGVGLAGLAVGATLFLVETSEPGEGLASVVVTPEGAMVGMTWSLP